MRRPLLLTTVSALMIVGSASAQQGHVWSVNELRARPGQEAAYTQALVEFDLPIIDEVIRLGGAVSRRLMVKQVGNMQTGTHLLIIEYESWDQFTNVDPVFDQAARNLFGRPYLEIADAQYFSRRDVVRREVYRDPAGAM